MQLVVTAFPDHGSRTSARSPEGASGAYPRETPKEPFGTPRAYTTRTAEQFMFTKAARSNDEA
jgi:hypothetical protein